jgi:hypothetical protein
MRFPFQVVVLLLALQRLASDAVAVRLLKAERSPDGAAAERRSWMGTVA